MTNNWNENKKEYLEALKRKGEIEFNYNNHYYHIEPADYKSDDLISGCLHLLKVMMVKSLHDAKIQQRF